MIQKNSLLANATMLISGTGAAQLVALLALPLMTRLYAPEDFGVFSIYAAILSIGAVLVCLRYELAIVLPKSEKLAKLVFNVAIISSIIVSMIFILIIFFFSKLILDLYGLDADQLWIWLLPLSLFIGGCYKASIFWHTREKNYKNLAIAKVSQSLPQTVIQLLLGFTGIGVIGLVLGEIAGKFFGAISLRFLSYKKSKQKMRIKNQFDLTDKVAIVTGASKGIGEYFLAGRSLNKYVVALSAVASGRSAWLLIGFVGIAYAKGVAAIWAALGYIVVECLMFFFYAPKLRKLTEENDDLTIPDFYVSQLGDRSGLLRGILVLVIANAILVAKRDITVDDNDHNPEH